MKDSRNLACACFWTIPLLLVTASGVHAALGDCGQPVSGGGAPLASDALQILRVAVGTNDCESCICDVDSSGTISASDSLLTLKKAVQQPVDLDCVACAASETIGSAGGIITSADGRLNIVVPPGALAEDTEITISGVAPSSIPEGLADFAEFKRAYELGPDGLVFDPPLEVAYEIDGAGVATEDGVGFPLGLLLSTDAEGEPEALEDLVTRGNATTLDATITGTLAHFSPLGVTFGGNSAVRLSNFPSSDDVGGDSFTASIVAAESYAIASSSPDTFLEATAPVVTQADKVDILPFPFEDFPPDEKHSTLAGNCAIAGAATATLRVAYRTEVNLAPFALADAAIDVALSCEGGTLSQPSIVALLPAGEPSPVVPTLFPNEMFDVTPPLGVEYDFLAQVRTNDGDIRVYTPGGSFPFGSGFSIASQFRLNFGNGALSYFFEDNNQQTQRKDAAIFTGADGAYLFRRAGQFRQGLRIAEGNVPDVLTLETFDFDGRDDAFVLFEFTNGMVTFGGANGIGSYEIDPEISGLIDLTALANNAPVSGFAAPGGWSQEGDHMLVLTNFNVMTEDDTGRLFDCILHTEPHSASCMQIAQAGTNAVRIRCAAPLDGSTVCGVSNFGDSTVDVFRIDNFDGLALEASHLTTIENAQTITPAIGRDAEHPQTVYMHVGGVDLRTIARIDASDFVTTQALPPLFGPSTADPEGPDIPCNSLAHSVFVFDTFDLLGTCVDPPGIYFFYHLENELAALAGPGPE